jgi:hypothetical protein
MIAAIIWPFLRAYWKPLFVLVLLIAAIVMLDHWGNTRERAGYEKAQAQAKAELEKWQQHQREIREESERDYLSQIQTLRAQAEHVRVGKPIRCVLGDSNQVRVPGASDLGYATAASGQSTVQPATDLRGQLVSHGEQCESLRQQVIALQAWINAAGAATAK